jgi:pilus assembly protein CpaF
VKFIILLHKTAALEILRCAVLDRKNILISGGTSTGKTTMLNALATFIDDKDRIVLIEDTAELQLTHDNLVRFEARRQQASSPAVTIRDLLKATLRHRPDRILLGEVRGAEAFDLLQALNTGHSGTLATIHANNAAQAITRLSSCVLQSGSDLPFHAIRSSIADCVNLLIHIDRRNGRRYVSELGELSASLRIGRGSSDSRSPGKQGIHIVADAIAEVVADDADAIQAGDQGIAVVGR